MVIDADGAALAFTSHCERRAQRLTSAKVSRAAVGRETVLLVASTGLIQIETQALEKPRCVRLRSGLEAAVVACGARHCLVATRCGSLFAWGEAAAGQLGLGDEPQQLKKFRKEPCQVLLADGTVKVSYECGSVSCGANHSAAVATDGTLWTWGWSEHGRLGRLSGSVRESSRLSSTAADEPEEDEDGCPSGVPRIVPLDDERVRAVACGSCHTLALTETGDIFGCGWNEYGQACGKSSVQQTSIVAMTRVCFQHRSRRPKSELGSFRAVAIAAGLAHSLALDANGTACAWGFGEDGQLGYGTERSSRIPVEVATTIDRRDQQPTDQRPFGFTAIAAAGTHSVGVATTTDIGSLRARIEERRVAVLARTAAATQLQVL